MLDSYEKTETRLEIMAILDYYRAHKGNPYYRAHKGNPYYRAHKGNPYYRAHKGNPYYPLESRESRESLS